MLEELVQAKKITIEEFELYTLYQSNELGRKCKDRMMHETYMDEPNEKEFNGVGFAFYDGRRSVFRDINRAILKVEHYLKEHANVGSEQPGRDNE